MSQYQLRDHAYVKEIFLYQKEHCSIFTTFIYQNYANWSGSFEKFLNNMEDTTLPYLDHYLTAF